MEKTDIVIIGAGVVGLAVGFELSKSSKDIIIFERHESFGKETSSRNSEVIHGGMYYPRNSFKHKTCVEGRPLLYEYCEKHNVPHKKISKIIVAVDEKELKELEALFQHGLGNGISDLKFLSKDGVRKLEPHVRAEAAIFSPSTGILDTHSFMKSLAAQFESQGGLIAYNSEVIGIDRKIDGYEITVRNEGEDIKFFSRVVINSAGLASDKIAAMVGLNKDEYRLKFCKGDYFRANQSKSKFISRLVYPVPTQNHTGLGIHATLDLGGSMRFGPDTEYVNEIRYDVNPAKAKLFYKSVKRFLPFIELNDLGPDTAGMRPKLQGPGEPVKDFVIKEERENGFPGFINLIGIESPGLTGSLSIAKIVRNFVK